jgi:hypothetical protein
MPDSSVPSCASSPDAVAVPVTRFSPASRPGEHFSRGALLDHAATVEHHHPVGKHQRVDDLVGHDEGDPVGQHRLQQRSQRGSELHVHRGQRFIQQQQLRLRGQRSGQRDALRLAAGQPPGAPVGELGGVDLGEVPQCGLPGISPAGPGGQWAERDIFQYR